MLTVEGRIVATGSDRTGTTLTISGPEGDSVVFLPAGRSDEKSNVLKDLRLRDRVRVSGVTTQDCPFPPHNRPSCILLNDSGSVTLVERGPLLAPTTALGAIIAMALMLALRWFRDLRRTALSSAATNALNALGEQMIALGSPVDIAAHLAEQVPKAAGATRIRLYTLARKTNTLERVPNAAEPELLRIDTVAPSGPLATGAALAFRDRKLLNITDTRRSRFFKSFQNAALPRSILFVPALAQDEIVGVLEIAHAETARYFTPELRAAFEHLANHVATALKFHQERAAEEQLYRNQKLAATGQLVTAVAVELERPLTNVLSLAGRLMADAGDSKIAAGLCALNQDAQQACDILARLMSFGRRGELETTSLAINALLTRLVRQFEPEWKLRGLEVQTRFCPGELYTSGAQGQIEQVFLNLLVHAGQCVTAAAERVLSIETNAAGGRAMVDFTFALDAAMPDPLLEDSSAGVAPLAVWRTILRAHGGDVRFFRPSAASGRFEVGLPLADGPQTESAVENRSRTLTMLLIEPDSPFARRLVEDLSRRGHRVVPVPTAEEAIDLAGRLSFDVLLSSAGLNGLDWPHFHQRIRSLVAACVLITDGFNRQPGFAASAPESFLLDRSAYEQSFSAVLAAIEKSLAGPTSPAPV